MYKFQFRLFSVVLTESGHPLKTVHSVYLAESFFIITGIRYCEPAFSLITLTNDIL